MNYDLHVYGVSTRVDAALDLSLKPLSTTASDNHVVVNRDVRGVPRAALTAWRPVRVEREEVPEPVDESSLMEDALAEINAGVAGPDLNLARLVARALADGMAGVVWDPQEGAVVQARRRTRSVRPADGPDLVGARRRAVRRPDRHPFRADKR